MTLTTHQPRPLHVGFLIDRLGRAGTETQLLALIAALDRRRVRPFLYLLDGTDVESRRLAPADCPVTPLGLTSFKRPGAVLKAARLAARFRRDRLDVLQTYLLDSTYLGVPLAKLAGVRRVVRVRNNLGDWLTPGHRLLGLLYGRLADVTLTNSRAGHDALQRAERLSPRRLAVLENGVDLDRFLAIPLPDFAAGGVVRVGAVANLRPVKDLPALVEAAAALAPRFPGLLVQVAGEGPQRPELERLIAERGLVGRVQLLGPVADVPAFLARQDVAVLCSLAEGMSNALLEYLAAARAVVATAVGAATDLIRNGEDGLLVPPGNTDALTRALGRLLSDPDLARRLGASGRRRVQERHGRSAMRQRFEEFYEALCGRRPPPPVRPDGPFSAGSV